MSLLHVDDALGYRGRLVEIVHVGATNAIDLELHEDGQPVDFVDVTRVVLTYGRDVIDSDFAGIGPGEVFEPLPNGRLVLRLGAVTQSESGQYPARLELWDQGVGPYVWAERNNARLTLDVRRPVASP